MRSFPATQLVFQRALRRILQLRVEEVYLSHRNPLRLMLHVCRSLGAAASVAITRARHLRKSWVLSIF